MVGTLTKVPQLTVMEQIEHLKRKGVKFNYISEQEAIEYLSNNNYYFKLRAYRKSFEKYNGGEKDDTYIDLDFAMLKDLSIIDMRLRNVLLLMTLDIEHFEKVKLLKYISASDDDGYGIVNEFMKYLKTEEDSGGHKSYTKLLSEIDRNTDNEYCGGIVSKYRGDYPVWAFLEVIPFGSFLSFLKFCGDHFSEKEFMDDFYLLHNVKRLRNAAAHNNCIIYNLLPNTKRHRTNFNVSRFLGKPEFKISKSCRDIQLSNAAVNDIVTLIYAHRTLVSSKGVLSDRRNQLGVVIERCYKNIHYYKNNDVIMTTFDFLKKVVDKAYEV